MVISHNDKFWFNLKNKQKKLKRFSGCRNKVFYSLHAKNIVWFFQQIICNSLLENKRKNNFWKYKLFLTLYNIIEKCLCIRFVCLSVYLRTNSRKYSSNVLEFMYVILIWYSMDRIKNGVHRTNSWSTETDKSFPIYYSLWWGDF